MRWSRYLIRGKKTTGNMRVISTENVMRCVWFQGSSLLMHNLMVFFLSKPKTVKANKRAFQSLHRNSQTLNGPFFSSRNIKFTFKLLCILWDQFLKANTASEFFFLFHTFICYPTWTCCLFAEHKEIRDRCCYDQTKLIYINGSFNFNKFYYRICWVVFSFGM